MKVRRLIFKATLLSSVLSMSVFAMAQRKTPQTSEQIKITKVEFVSEYKAGNYVCRPTPNAVIAVVQTNRQPKGDRPDIKIGLDDYVFQYTTAGSKTGSIPAYAVGEQAVFSLPQGDMAVQYWHTGPAGSFNNTVGPSQYISGLTLLAVLPKDVTSFTLTIKHLNFVSGPIRHEPGKDSPAK
jgi:hypothetical protein